MTDPIVVRQSDYNSYALCPARLKYRETEGYVSVPSEAMSFGTLVHKLIEKFLANPNDLVLSSVAKVIQLWDELVREDTDGEYGLYDLAAEELRLDSVLEAMEALQSWQSAIWLPYLKGRNVLATEAQLDAMIDNDIILQGTLDMILEDGIWDWKTATRPWREGKAEANIQAAAYSFLARMREYPLSLPIEFTYAVYSRKDARWDRHQVFIDRNAIDAMRQVMIELGNAKRHRVFVATPQANGGKLGRNWHCSAKYCGAWNVCVEKGIIPDGADLTEQSEIAWR